MQAPQEMHFSPSVTVGSSAGMAPAGQSRAHWPHLVHAGPHAGWKGTPLTGRRSWLPFTTMGVWAPSGRKAAIRSRHSVPKPAMAARSRSSGRPAATWVKMECSATKAPAATTRNPLASSRSWSSARASS